MEQDFARIFILVLAMTNLKEWSFIILTPALILAPLSMAQNAATAKSNQPLAVVGGQPITEDDLAPLVQGPLRPLREQEYQIKKKALESLINQWVLEPEAKKKNFSTEKLLEQ